MTEGVQRDPPDSLDDVEWEEARCAFCHELASEPVLERPDLLMDLPGIFKIVRCTTCGLHRLDPRPTEDTIEAFYPQHYTAYEPIIEEEEKAATRWDRRYGMWKRLRFLSRHQKSGRLLDIGCGTGIFLAEARRSRSWEIHGLEPNARAAEYVKNRLGCPIWQTSFPEETLEPSSFDLITMWNVLEHLFHPVEAINRCHELLQDHGVLVLSIPNMESWEKAIFGKYWLGWDPPRHLYLFSHRHLQQVLEEAGFRIESRRCIATAHAALGITLEMWLKGATSLPENLRSALLSGYRSRAARLLLAPSLWISDQFKRSSIILYIARKRSTT